MRCRQAVAGAVRAAGLRRGLQAALQCGRLGLREEHDEVRGGCSPRAQSALVQVGGEHAIREFELRRKLVHDAYAAPEALQYMNV